MWRPHELDMGDCEDEVDGEVECEGPDENTDEIALLADFGGEGDEEGEEEVEDHGETDEGKEEEKKKADEAQRKVEEDKAVKQMERFLYLRHAFDDARPKTVELARVCRQHSAATASRCRCQK